jgi:archaemetzincin
MRLLSILFCLGFYSCINNTPQKKSRKSGHEHYTSKVIILPLGTIDSPYSSFLKQEIPKIYKVEVQLAAAMQMPQTAFYKPRQRYIADSLLVFLRARSENKNEYVLGITSSDISTSAGNNVNWGVMGLGYRPGNACVISPFRIKGNLKNSRQLYNRFLKVALHELGHNFGLDHCADQHCIMVDAEGKNKLDGEDHLCKNCTNVLQKKGVL